MNTSRILTWSIISGVIALIYSGFYSFAMGGMNFDRLVSGNVKRISAMERGVEIPITSYDIQKEYRPWKGFLFGFLSALAIIVGGIVLGCNQENLSATQALSKSTGVFMIVIDAFAGYVLLPIQAFNKVGISVSGFIGCAFAIFPILVSGIFYILGAYAKRNKRIREEEIARRIQEEKQNKPQKINYGGLPGTKPRKK